ncbi:MAG: hypothetical protein ACLQF0_05665 [Dissulfurispiraceae bacterium]
MKKEIVTTTYEYVIEQKANVSKEALASFLATNTYSLGATTIVTFGDETIRTDAPESCVRTLLNNYKSYGTKWLMTFQDFLKAQGYSAQKIKFDRSSIEAMALRNVLTN